MKNEITWSASNSSSYLNGSRRAKTLMGALRAARSYLNTELCGEGVITIYVDGLPVRRDEKSIRTGGNWDTASLY